MDKTKITRLVVIDHTNEGEGVLVERWDIGVGWFETQDDGRTLKIELVDKEKTDE